MDGTLHLLGARSVWIGTVLGDGALGIERRVFTEDVGQFPDKCVSIGVVVAENGYPGLESNVREV